MLVLCCLFGVDTGEGGSLNKEVLDDFRDEAPLLGLRRLAYNGREVQLPLSQTFKGGIGDLSETLSIYIFNDSVLDDFFGKVMAIHLPQHPFQLISRKYVT